MRRILIVASTAALLATTSAHAQEALGAAVDKLTTSAVGGMTMGDHATSRLEVEKSQTGSLLTSKLIGATVYNNKQDTIGNFEDPGDRAGQGRPRRDRQRRRLPRDRRQRRPRQPGQLRRKRPGRDSEAYKKD